MSAVLVPYAGKANPGSWHDQARVLRMNGAKLSQIAAMFGVTVQTAGQVVRGIKCPINHQRIAARKNIRAASVACRTKPHRGAKLGTVQRHWNNIEHDQFIRANYNAGLSAAQIAKRLGVTRNAVIGRAHRLGLSVPL